MMLTGETLKNAIAIQLMKSMPELNVYKESISTPKFPHCVISLLNINCSEERKGYYLLSYNFMLQYRVVADLSSYSKLQQALDRASLIFMETFDLLKVDDEYVRCTDKSTEKSEGILLFNFNIKLLVNKIDLENLGKVDKMRILDYNVYIKENK